MLRESEIAVSNFLSYKKFFKSLEAWSTHEFENLLEFLSISFVLMKKICLPHKIIFFCVVHRPATHPDLIGISRFFSTNLGVSWFPDSTSENPEFLFRFEIGKTKGRLTLLHGPCLQTHKVWAKNKCYDRLNPLHTATQRMK